MTSAVFMETLVPIFLAPKDTVTGKKIYCDSLGFAIDNYVKTLLDPSNNTLMVTASQAFSAILFSFLGPALSVSVISDANFAAIAHATAFQSYMFSWQAMTGMSTMVLVAPGRTPPGTIITNTIFRPPVIPMQNILFQGYQTPTTGTIESDAKKAALYFTNGVLSVLNAVVFTIQCLDKTPPPLIDIGPIPYTIIGGFKIT
jgi:hypothetical protein